MSEPIIVNLPHKLGVDEAKRRISGGIGKLKDFIPGGAKVDAAWIDDRMTLMIAAMGQEINAHIDVEERLVRLEVNLPMFLTMFAEKIRAALASRGSDLLDDKR